MTAEAVKGPYIFLGATLIVIAVIIAFTKLPRFTGETIERGLGVLKFSHLTLGVIAIFMYVGGEVAIGTFLVRYFGEIKGFSEITAAGFVSYFWGGAMVGRFVGSISLTNRTSSQKYGFIAIISLIAVVTVYFLTENINIALIVLGLIAGNAVIFSLGKSLPARTLAIFSICVVLLLIVTVVTSGDVAMWSVIAIGLFNSIMFPTIFTLAIRDLGKYTSQGSSLLVMAIVGGAIIPPLMGYLADKFSFQQAYLFPALCYLYVFYYGWKGHEVKRKAV